MKKLLYISFLVLLFAACKGDPIFYALENEEKIEDSNNFKKTTPVNRIILFNDAGQDYYVTHGKQLWYSIAGSVQSPWNIVPKPEGYGSTSVVSSIAVYNSKVYVSLIDEDNNSKTGLYYITEVDGQLIKVLEYERRIDSVNNNDYYFYTLKLIPIEGGLYIVRTNRKWNTLTSDSSTVVDTEIFYFDTVLEEGVTLESGTAVSLPGLSGSPYVVRNMTSTGTDTNEIYMIVNEVGEGIDYYASGKLFVADASTPESFTEENPGESSSFNSVYYSDIHDILLLSTRETGRNHSILYKLNNSGSWGAWQTNLEGGDDVQFSAFTDISEMSGVGDIILVGTRGDVIDDSQTYYNGNGYYELNLSDRSNPVIQSNTFALDTNYNSTDLKNATIMNFLYDSDRDKVYTSTSSYGLWLNQMDDGDRKWYQE